MAVQHLQTGGPIMTALNDNHGTTSLDTDTVIVTAGRDTKSQRGFVNPPVVRGSTVLYPTADDLHAHRGEYQYGREHPSPSHLEIQPADSLPVCSFLLGQRATQPEDPLAALRIPVDIQRLQPFFVN